MNRDPCKIAITVEVEVVNRRKLERHAKRQPNFSYIDGDFDEEYPNGPQVSELMEAVHSKIETIPGVECIGLTGISVEWFEHDHLVDKRHPDYEKNALRHMETTTEIQ